MGHCLRKQVTKLENSITSLLDRLVEATNASMVTRYEQRIAEFECEKYLVAEKLENAGKPKNTDRKTFERALSFLSNPWELWESDRLERKRIVLKLTFANRLSYCKKRGVFQPKKTSSVF